ncbi:hypothetical protein CPB83DRAFT_246174 [Crepidotus variabilis]|uniref:Uncharacterized protein n=1 Tax=Crepidotus variabilis TaxID=179855 RepID=A0A9P6E2Y2_9AGAR|nr:hypothetical protein CPB83DRAFT_246174 [Crepidotus variabilis]
MNVEQLLDSTPAFSRSSFSAPFQPVTRPHGDHSYGAFGGSSAFSFSTSTSMPPSLSPGHMGTNGHLGSRDTEEGGNLHQSKRPRSHLSDSTNHSHSFNHQYTPPPVAGGIPPEIAKALADQANLSDARRLMFNSFHRACTKLPEKNDAMMRLLTYVLILQNTDKLDELAASLAKTSEKVETLYSATLKNFTVSKDLQVQIRTTARATLLEPDRRLFRDMFTDVQAAIESRSDDLSITSALQIAAHKRKIVTAIKGACNEAREFLRRLIVNSVMSAGPTRMSLDDFCARVLDKMGKDTQVVMSPELAGHLALMRAYTLGQLDRRGNVDSTPVPESDEGDDNDTTGSSSQSKSRSTKSQNQKEEEKFWVGFEKYMFNKVAEGGSKTGFNLIVRRIIEADRLRFPPLTTNTSLIDSALKPSSSSSSGQVATFEMVNDFLD